MSDIQKFRGLIESGQITDIVFDFDGTLYSSSAGIEAQLKPVMVQTTMEFLSLSKDEATILLRTYRGQYKSSVLGLSEHHNVDPFAFYQRVYSQLDTSAMQAYEGLAEGLLQLSAACNLHVLTNSSSAFALPSLERLGLAIGIFDKVYTVEDNGFIRKPNPEVYESLFRDKLGRKPHSVAFFDDIASSLKVVAGLGGTTILVGNGLREVPCFYDLHTDDEFNGKPDFVDMAAHSISDFITGVVQAPTLPNKLGQNHLNI